MTAEFKMPDGRFIAEPKPAQPFFQTAFTQRKIFHSEDLIRCVENAGLKVTEISDGIGRGHSILRCEKVV